MMEFSWFDMSDSHSMWNTANLGGPVTKTIMATSTANTPPPYSHTLDLESRMIDVAVMGQSGLGANDSSQRHAICPAVEPLHVAPAKLRGRGKQFVDPCEVAPLKKRRIQLEMLSPDERERVIAKREKNKAAAEKCRVKRKEKVQRVRTEYEDCVEENEALEAEVRKLREEYQIIRELFDKHHCVCNSSTSSS